MRAVEFSEWQTFPSLESVAQPEPRPGEALLKVAGAGACHSDYLYDVVAMYRAGQIRPAMERFPMDGAIDACRRLESGELSGRAVVTPHENS